MRVDKNQESLEINKKLGENNGNAPEMKLEWGDAHCKKMLLQLTFDF